MVDTVTIAMVVIEMVEIEMEIHVAVQGTTMMLEEEMIEVGRIIVDLLFLDLQI